MDDRLFLEHIDLKNNTVLIEGKQVPIKENLFPTIDKNNPYGLTKEENEILLKLRRNFVSSQRLRKHIQFLYDKGSMYNVYNNMS